MPSSTAIRLGLWDMEKNSRSVAGSPGAGSGSTHAAAATNPSRLLKPASPMPQESAGKALPALAQPVPQPRGTVEDGMQGGTAGVSLPEFSCRHAVTAALPPVPASRNSSWRGAAGESRLALHQGARWLRALGRGYSIWGNEGSAARHGSMPEETCREGVTAAAVTTAHAAPGRSPRDSRAAWATLSNWRNGFCWGQAAAAFTGSAARLFACILASWAARVLGFNQPKIKSWHTPGAKAQPAGLTVPASRGCSPRGSHTPCRCQARLCRHNRELGHIPHLTCLGNDTPLLAAPKPCSGSIAGRFPMQRQGCAIADAAIGGRHCCQPCIVWWGQAQRASRCWLKCTCCVCCCRHRGCCRRLCKGRYQQKQAACQPLPWLWASGHLPFSSLEHQHLLKVSRKRPMGAGGREGGSSLPLQQ